MGRSSIGLRALSSLVLVVGLIAASCGGATPAATSATPAASTAAPAAATAAPSAKPTPSGPAIKLACICDQTGSLASNGRAISEGALLQADRINSAGGVLGRPLQVIVYDDKSTPTLAVQMFLKATQSDGVSAVIMGGSSSNALAVMPEAQRAGVPLVLANQQAQGLTTPTQKGVFRVTFSALGYAKGFIAFLKWKNLTKVGIFHRDDAYGTSGRDNIRVAMKDAGIQIVGEVALQPDGKDFTAQVQKLRAAGPDVIISQTFPNEAVVFMQNVRTLGWTNVTVIGAGSWAVPETLASPAVQGAFYPDLLDMTKPEVKTFTEEYFKKFGRNGENTYTVWGADSVGITAAVIAKAKSDKPGDILANFEGTKYTSLEGSTGTYLNYSASDHDGPKNDGKSPWSWSTIESGKTVPITVPAQ